MASTTPAVSPSSAATTDEDNKQQDAQQQEEEEVTPQDPQLRLAELAHLHSLPTMGEDVVVSPEEHQRVEDEILKLIKENDMSFSYKSIFPATPDKALLETMEAANKKQLAEFDAKEAEAQEKAGETEVQEVRVNRARYLAKIGDKAGALAAFETALAKAVGGAARITIAMATLRLMLAHGDLPGVRTWLQKADELIEKEGDWEHRNRLGIYKAVYAITERDYKTAAKHLVDAVPTFTCSELVSFETFVLHTVLTAMVHCDRVTLKDKVVTAPDILQSINDVPHLQPFLHALYECKYSVFFQHLIPIAALHGRERLICTHASYFLREVRLVAYTQFLASYQSVTLDSMARLFGVSASFIDKELSRFIAAGRVNCKIDSVSGVVQMSLSEKRDTQYLQLVKQGDILLNRVQKLTQQLKSA